MRMVINGKAMPKSCADCYYICWDIGAYKDKRSDECPLKEQEPCKDAVSRQAVDTLIDELARAISDERCCISRGRSTATIMQDILDLPPVTPQPKMGYWRHYEGMIYCSKCGAEFYDDIMEYCGDDVPKCCPDCGQPKMFEPQAERK